MTHEWKMLYEAAMLETRMEELTRRQNPRCMRDLTKCLSITACLKKTELSLTR
jgi:hypothetical protein